MNCYSNAADAKQIENSVFVGYGSRWQNPFSFSNDPETEVKSFQRWFYSDAYAAKRLRSSVEEQLRNKVLLCDCCNDLHCHIHIYVKHLENTAPSKRWFRRSA